MIDRILGDVFRVLPCPFLEYCSAVFCSAVDTHLKLLDRVVSGAHFRTGGVFECDIAHRRSVTVLYMLYKVWCNAIHPVCLWSYVPVRVTLGALVAHPYTYARFLSAKLRSTAGPSFCSQCPCGTIWMTLYSMVCDWRGSRAEPMLFYLLSCSIAFCLLLFFHFFSFWL